MPSATRLFARSTLIMAAAAVALMFAVPAAFAKSCPRALVFAVQPTTTQVQTTMTPAVVVDVENSQGHLVTNFDGSVTLSYAVNNVGAPLPANNVVNAVNGVATFSGLTFSAVGFGFELQASTGEATSSPSQPFDIVTQLVHCQSGQTCQTETVSSAGTSGFAVAGTASTSDVLTATGGGFPSMSCTVVGGVLTFTVTDRSKTITMMLSKSLVQQEPGPGAAHFNVCWGSPTSFITLNGKPSMFNPANNEYEGLLPDCSAGGPSPCVVSRHKANAGVEVITVSAPSGDPRISG
jgi:hypothetical protein